MTDHSKRGVQAVRGWREEETSSDTLYLIDASNWAHRAYHAGGGALSATLASMVRSFLARARSPRSVVAALDSTGPTFRRELYPAYKGSRDHDETLRAQLADVEGVFRDLGVRCISAPLGVEADDVLATLAVKGQASFQSVLILSADLDLLQVVSPRIRLGFRRRGAKTVYGPQAVREKYGIEPSQWPEVLAVCGKPANSIPGLPGIGVKGACELVARFGSLEELLRNPRRVERKSYRRALESPKNAEKARLWLQLTRLRADLPIDPYDIFLPT